MIDYKNQKVYCDKCKKYLGNYNTCTDEHGNEKSYYALIKLKYCDECRLSERRKQNRNSQHTYTERTRAKKQVMKEEIRLLKAENKALKIKLFGTQNAEQTRALIELLKA